MARPRYPSDERALKKPSGVILGFSVLNPDPDKPGHAEVFDDPEMRGIWAGLLLLAGHAFAGRTGDRVTLNDGQLTWCTGRAQRRHALSALRTLCERMEYTLDDRGRSVVVHVKNLSQNQGWTTSAPRSAPRTPSVSESESESESDKRAPPSRSRRKPTDPPASSADLDAATKERIADWVREKEPWAADPQRLRDLIDACFDYHAANGKKRADWVRTAQNWIRKARTDFGAGTNEARAGPELVPLPPPEQLAELASAVRPNIRIHGEA